MAPGHVPVFLEDTDIFELSPAGQLAEVMQVVIANAAALQSDAQPMNAGAGSKQLPRSSTPSRRGSRHPVVPVVGGQLAGQGRQLGRVGSGLPFDGGPAWSTTVVNSDSVPSRLSATSMTLDWERVDVGGGVDLPEPAPARAGRAQAGSGGCAR